MTDRREFNEPEEGTNRDRSQSGSGENKSSSKNDRYSYGLLEVTEGPPHREDFFRQQQQRQREDLRQTLADDPMLRLKGGVPQSKEAIKEIIKEAMRRNGHDYEDHLLYEIKRRKGEHVTKKESQASSYCSTIRSRIKKNINKGIEINIEDIVTPKERITEKGIVIASHMAEEELNDLASYRRKQKSRVKFTKNERSANAKYTKLLASYNKGELKYNEAGSSQQNADSYGSRELLADLGNLNAQINRSWDESQENWQQIKDTVIIENDSSEEY